jgi:uncharacterized protein YjbI with pentapeptide repeats
VNATDRRRQAALLGVTLLVAVAVTTGVAALVARADPAAGFAEAVKTGGLSGAAVVALYGLWLNDRRRRVEEDRQVVEEERLRVEGGRIANERFARAVELLGHDADQVRVGALHALVGLARSTPSYTQTVVDVLCSYLRRPYFHHAYERAGHDPARDDHVKLGRGRLTDEDAADDRERQVRLTAQRVLMEVLPEVTSPAAPAYGLDLTGASLEYFDLRARRTGDLIARGATFYGITRLGHAMFDGKVMFTSALFRGRLEMPGCRFSTGLSLLEAQFDGLVDLTGAQLGGFADLRWKQSSTVGLDGVVADERVRLKVNAGVSIPRSPPL